MSIRGWALALWLLFVAGCVGVALNSRYSTDMSAFLPSSPSAEQRLLVEQLKSGLASRLILVGIESGDPASRARLSQALAARLRSDPAFAYIGNGENTALEIDRRLLLEYRYALSPALDGQRYTVAGLRAGIEDSLELLASSAGMMLKPLISRDPTGEFMQLLDRLDSGARPQTRAGVWVSRDGRRAVLLARTRAQGSDTDAQEAAMGVAEAIPSEPSASRGDGW